MGKKTVGLGAVVVVLVLLASYVLQEPSFTPEVLREHLHGKVVVVCGASSGIGEETVYKFAATGAKLIISARSRDKLAEVRDKALKHGASSVNVVVQDFSKIEEIASFHATVLSIHSEIDILLLNHAAIPLGPWTSFEKQQSAQFTLRTFNINILSFIELTRLFLVDLELSGGQVLVTGSVSGSCPYYEAGLYTSTKHAVNGFFYSLQQELYAKESNVSVTVFTLGLIMTPNMATLMNSEPQGENIPDMVKGDVHECADVIVGAALTRPRNVDYPSGLVKLARISFNWLASYHELVSKSTGITYDESVQTHLRLQNLGKKLNYQVGNTA